MTRITRMRRRLPPELLKELLSSMANDESPHDPHKSNRGRKHGFVCQGCVCASGSTQNRTSPQTPVHPAGGAGRSPSFTTHVPTAPCRRRVPTARRVALAWSMRTGAVAWRGSSTDLRSAIVGENVELSGETEDLDRGTHLLNLADLWIFVGENP